MKNPTIFLGLGSNLGAKTTNLRNAIRFIRGKGVEIIFHSSYYKTPPWGIESQDYFINVVVGIKFLGNVHELLEMILGTEEEMGRVRNEKWGPRLIDIDILEFDGLQIDEENLQVPHPWYLRRLFVLVPFAEIAPEFIPTGHAKSIEKLLSAFPISEIEEVQAVETYLPEENFKNG